MTFYFATLCKKGLQKTIVIAYGKNKDRYAVRERIGCKYKHGRRIPVNGPTIGHIVGGKYVPRLSGTDPLTLTLNLFQFYPLEGVAG